MKRWCYFITNGVIHETFNPIWFFIAFLNSFEIVNSAFPLNGTQRKWIEGEANKTVSNS